jgi:hypothetical protein
MKRITLALLAAVLLSPEIAAADEAMAKKMAALMPKMDGWAANPPAAVYNKDGMSKGAWAHGIYRKPNNNAIIIRLMDTPPMMHQQAIADPGKLGAETVTVKGYKGFANTTSDKNGGMALLAGTKVAEFNWSGGATKDDAIKFAEATDLKALAELK